MLVAIVEWFVLECTVKCDYGMGCDRVVNCYGYDCGTARVISASNVLLCGCVPRVRDRSCDERVCCGVLFVGCVPYVDECSCDERIYCVVM